MRRRDSAFIVVICTALGAVVLAWDGPGRWLIRGAGGDVIAVVWLAFLIQCVMRRWSSLRCAGIAGGVAFTLEAIQGLGWVPAHAPRWIRIALGATFDPFDLVAYALGAIVAIALGRGYRRLNNFGEVFGDAEKSI